MLSEASLLSTAFQAIVSRHQHNHPEEERRTSVIRTRKITGQLGAIERMPSEDQDCAEVLTQIVSARRGLKSLAEKLIHSHVQHCIENAQNPTEGKRKLRELLTVLERYVE
jgi:DNA-binding FrmR family transcriptional regulator